ncbi:MAG: sulfite exporter TauE/SafE family protein [Planctomycetes bacterium]|nr:sulfite exporter TauE/SafE family protein [Planctomycetota bacterium]
MITLELLPILALLAGGFLMGFVNNVAGGGGVIGLLALEDVVHLHPVHANASLRVAAVAIGGTGWLGFRERGVAMARSAWLYGLLAVPGALLGSVMVHTLPVWLYRAALAAVLVLVLWQQLRPSARSPEGPVRAASPLVTVLLFTLMGVHMGFIQVGAGLVTMATLSFLHTRDLLLVNTAKLAIVIVTSAASVLYLHLVGRIEWEPALFLAAGAGAGSYAASHWSVAKGHQGIRVLVLVITIAVLARLCWQMASTWL